MKIGNDIVKISKMEKVFNNKNLFNRYFTPLEQSYILNATNPSLRFERMAGKVAIKEAVSKAFGFGIGKELRWLDIETDHQKSGKPIIIKNDKIVKIMQKFNYSDMDVSISHMDEYATAVCLIF